MEFIGYTALIDAVVVLVSWVVLFARSKKMQPVSQKIKYLNWYLVLTVVFLLLVAYAIFGQSDMMTVLLVADLVLWVSMVIFIMMMYVGTSGGQQGLWIGIFLIFAAMRTTWQVAQITGVDTSSLGDFMNNEFLGKLDQWLMYAVWVPAAIALIVVGLKSENALVRLRSLLFSIGLLLISFTWAFRFMGAGNVSVEIGYGIVGVGSVIGFILLLMGFLYKKNDQQIENTN